MTRREEAGLIRLWHEWSVGKPYTNQTLADFFFDVVRTQPKLKHISAFEVMDSVTNAEPQAALAQTA